MSVNARKGVMKNDKTNGEAVSEPVAKVSETSRLHAE